MTTSKYIFKWTIIEENKNPYSYLYGSVFILVKGEWHLLAHAYVPDKSQMADISKSLKGVKDFEAVCFVWWDRRIKIFEGAGK